MNDQQLIWEAYKNPKTTKPTISPIKQNLIDLVKGFRELRDMIQSYFSFYEKKFNTERRECSKRGEEITPEEKRKAEIFKDEYLRDRRDTENITKDNYEDEVWGVHEDKTEHLYWDEVENLKTLGLTEDHARQLIDKYCVGYDYTDDIAKYAIETIMNADI